MSKERNKQITIASRLTTEHTNAGQKDKRYRRTLFYELVASNWFRIRYEITLKTVITARRCHLNMIAQAKRNRSTSQCFLSSPSRGAVSE